MNATQQGKRRKKKPLSARVTGRIDEDTKKRLVTMAEKAGLDESDLVRMSLNQFLGAMESGSHLINTEMGLQARKGASPEAASDREIKGSAGDLQGEDDSNEAKQQERGSGE